jgi:hypothetical protein
MHWLSVLLILVVVGVIFVSVTAMIVAMAPYLALLAVIGIVCWLSSKAPDEPGNRRPRR